MVKESYKTKRRKPPKTTTDKHSNCLKGFRTYWFLTKTANNNKNPVQEEARLKFTKIGSLQTIIMNHKIWTKVKDLHNVHYTSFNPFIIYREIVLIEPTLKAV